MKPWCYNREERARGRWVRNGIYLRGGVAKPRYRWHQAFADINACHAYDEPAGTMSTAALRGYECAGCRWLPEHVR